MSTDCSDIWNDVCAALGSPYAGSLTVTYEGHSTVVIVHHRKPEHATDDSPIKDTLMDVVQRVNILNFGNLPYKMVLLQPTNPFRFKDTLERVIELTTPCRPYAFSAKTVPGFYENAVATLSHAGASGVATLSGINGVTPNGNVYCWYIEENHFPPDAMMRFGTSYLVGGNAFEHVDIDTVEDYQIACAIVSRLMSGCNLPKDFIPGHSLGELLAESGEMPHE